MRDLSIDFIRNKLLPCFEHLSDATILVDITAEIVFDYHVKSGFNVLDNSIINLIVADTYKIYNHNKFFFAQKREMSDEQVAKTHGKVVRFLTRFNLLLNEELKYQISIFNIEITIEDVDKMWRYFRMNHVVGMGKPFKGRRLHVSREELEKYEEVYQKMLEYFVPFFQNGSSILTIQVGNDYYHCFNYENVLLADIFQTNKFQDKAKWAIIYQCSVERAQRI